MGATFLFTLTVYGLAAVIALGSAALIRVMVVVLSAADRASAPAPAPAPISASVPAVPSAAAIPPDHLVVIAAAAHAALGAHRIVHIESATGPVWASEGRHSHHGSHRPSPRH